MSGSLMERLGITEESLRLRAEYVGLTPGFARSVESLIPWVERHADRLTEQFYDFQFRFAPTRDFLSRFADRKGVPLQALRQALHGHTRKYLLSLFEGAREQWGTRYFESRLAIGYRHDQVGLPFKWCLGAYVELIMITRRELLSGMGRRRDSKLLSNASEALIRLTNYDSQAIGDAYFAAVLDSLGLDLQAVEVTPPADRTDGIRDLIEIVSTLPDQAAAIAAYDLDNPILEQRIPGRLGEAFRTVITSLGHFSETIIENSRALRQVEAASTEFGISIEEISRNTCDATEVVSETVSAMDDAGRSIESLRKSSEEIDSVVGLITSISEQTNLLALNATIEAARSGEAGKGFAVVANEVKQLARKANAATDEIRKRIEQIQNETALANRRITRARDELERVNELTATIAAAVEEQSSVSKDLQNDVANTARASAALADHLCAKP